MTTASAPERAERTSAALSVLAVLAIASPFLWCFTRPPSTNFWPLVASWLCIALLLLTSAAQARVREPWSASHQARLLAAGLLLAALVSSSIGLAQYFGLHGAFLPWVYDAPTGQAMGNLRQRNQQATLLSLGVWTLVWWTAQRWRTGRVARRWYVVAKWTAMVLLAAGSAATASRTGLLQWLLLFGLAGLWRKYLGAGALKLLAGALLLYVLAGLILPALLWQATGVHGSGVFSRVTASYGCDSRRVLWANVIDLIALRPWRGWGWGELDYAHYITPFSGERFCTLLDNAHNLPLQIAVELGLPVALAVCAVAGALVWRARPWHETAPPRQLAWGVLLAIAAHSMLEFPLWYGPFQLVALCAVGLLFTPRSARNFKEKWPSAQYLKALAAIVLIVIVGAVARQYAAVSQLYYTVSAGSTALRLDAQGRVEGAPLFDDAARFAYVTQQTVTPSNAAKVHAIAGELLHYSPEPRVIERLIESAQLLGLINEAQFHRLRYAAAYPVDYARWQRGGKASGAPSH